MQWEMPVMLLHTCSIITLQLPGIFNITVTSFPSTSFLIDMLSWQKQWPLFSLKKKKKKRSTLHFKCTVYVDEKERKKAPAFYGTAFKKTILLPVVGTANQKVSFAKRQFIN